MIIFGLEVEGNPLEAAGRFLKEKMKVSNETLLKISLKQAYKLGKGENGKVPPFLIKFGHPQERNMILTHSKHLSGSKIRIERHIPKIYQEKFKDFKKLSWKLKTMPEMDYMTQIIFDSHVLLLRVKKKDTLDEKFHWTVHSSYTPPMDGSADSSRSSLKTPSGTKATPQPDVASRQKANNALFITIKGMTETITADTFQEHLKGYLKEEHKSLLDCVKTTKRPDLFIAYYDSWTTANTIATEYKDQLNGHDVSFELFSPTDPGQ